MTSKMGGETAQLGPATLFFVHDFVVVGADLRECAIKKATAKMLFARVVLPCGLGTPKPKQRQRPSKGLAGRGEI